MSEKKKKKNEVEYRLPQILLGALGLSSFYEETQEKKVIKLLSAKFAKRQLKVYLFHSLGKFSNNK